MFVQHIRQKEVEIKMEGVVNVTRHPQRAPTEPHGCLSDTKGRDEDKVTARQL